MLLFFDMKKGKTKKSNVQITNKGCAYIKVTFNNTIITMTNLSGEVIFWSSCGKVGFKGAKKSTPYAATQVAKNCVEYALQKGINELVVYIKGPGATRTTTLRALANGLKITQIKDCTGEPHNGCRPPKKRNP